MSSQIEAQNTYTQYSQLYQIAAQLNTQAQTDPSKAAEAQLASQQAHKAYAAYQAAWQKAYQDQKNLATQAVAAPAVGDNSASAAQHLLNSLIQQSAAATQHTPALNPLAGLPGIPAATPPAPATPSIPTAPIANQQATLQNLQAMFQQQIQQASMQAAAAAAQAATQQIMGKNNTLPAPTGLANLPSPMDNERPGYNNHRGGAGGNYNRPYTPRNNYNNRGGYNNRFENQSAHDRLGSRPYVKQEVDFNQPLHKITGSAGQADVHNVKDYAVLSTDSVFVEGLPYGVERIDVNDFFSQVGPLRVTANQQETGIGRIFLFLDENKKCNGTASVTFQQMDDAENCITLLNGKSFPVLRDDKVKTEKDDLMDQERSALGSPNSMGSRSEDEGDGGNYKRRGGSLNDILDDGKQSTLVNDPTKVVTIQGRRNTGQVITEEMKLRPWTKFDDKKYWTFKGKLSIRMATLGERDPIGERRQKMGLPHQHNFAAKQQSYSNNRGRGGYQRGGYHRGRGGYNNHRGGYNQAGGKVYQTNIPTRQYPY